MHDEEVVTDPHWIAEHWFTDSCSIQNIFITNGCDLKWKVQRCECCENGEKIKITLKEEGDSLGAEC